MTTDVVAQLTLIGLAAVLAPILARLTGRLAVPGVVMEILLGILIGPVVLGWAEPGEFVAGFAAMGLSMLMFLAGYEISPQHLRRRTIALALGSWAGSLVLAAAVAVVMLLIGLGRGNLVVAVALVTTALGTLLPALRDNGALETPFGRHVLALGSVGEFGPIVLIALLLSGEDKVASVLVLVAFAAVAALCVLAARLPWGERVQAELRRGLHSSSQLPVRASIVLIIAMVLIATHLGIDVLIGAFAAGVIIRVAVGGHAGGEESRIFEGKLEAIGFGFLIPIFFVVSGMRLDLRAFGDHPLALAAIPLFFVLLLVVRGVPTYLAYRRELPRAQTRSLAVLSATGLPLIVVVTTIGTANDYVDAQVAAALVTAGVLSVLVFPAVGLRMLSLQPEPISGESLGGEDVATLESGSEDDGA